MKTKHSATDILLSDLTALRQAAVSFLLPDSTKKALTGSGNTFSPFKSRGLDFQEVRVYQPGDDIRQIDWHITAKYGKPFTKLYTEEKERTIFFVVDLRANMQFATHGDFKSVVAARMAAFIAFIAEQQKEKVGYIILTDDTLVTGGEASSDAISPFLNALVKPSSGHQQSSWKNAIRLLNQFLPAGSFIFCLSDFHDWNNADTLLLAPLSEKNTFVFCSIYDNMESELPKGHLPFSDGKNTIMVDLEDDRARQRFHKEWMAQQNLLQTAAHKYDWGLLPISTDSDYIDILTRFCFGRSIA